MGESQCRYCTAAWGDIGLDCNDHDERVMDVARQLAGMVHDELTDERVGWFMEDAETVCAVVGDEPDPVVSNWQPRTGRFRVGNVRFFVNEEDGGLGWKLPSER